MSQSPRYELEIYRQFIREAAPYVSVIIGRRIQVSEASLMTDDEIAKIALIIDERVKELKPIAPKKG
ncbi:MAG: hypothetical protein V4760_14230 [Bdellovibrionota bacterium]